MSEPRTPFRWTERRVARFTTLLVAGAVVLLDLVLFYVYFQRVAPMLKDLALYRYMIPAGILSVLLFALRRFLSQLRMFREDQ
jgi:hypothetical protein